MKLFLPVLLMFCVMTLLSFSCKKPDKCEGGSGGNLSFTAYIEHHGNVISNQPGYPDSVFVRFNALDAPANNSGYNAFFVGSGTEDHVNLSGLKCGDYYFYATGRDTTLDSIIYHGQRVIGGISYSTSQTSGNIVIHIPVSEVKP